jgi:FkbH-like protein
MNSLNRVLEQNGLLNFNMISGRELNKLVDSTKKTKYLCHLVRTMPFEYVETPLKKISQIYERDFNFTYTDYDPSLTEINDYDEQVSIFWIDWRLYREKMTPQQVVDWITTRLEEVKGSQPIILNNWPTSWDGTDCSFALAVSERGWYVELNYLLMQLVEENARFILCDLDYLVGFYGHTAYDDRNDRVSSYPFSNRFTLELARYFGLFLLPAALQPKLKLVILDLDYTMYRGVLGEDGMKGIIFEENHLALQRLLIKLKNNGILLAISSKNELSDVEQLIDEHPQFLLKQDDFVFIEASWEEKANNIHSIIERVNIDPSAVVFIDDNAVELSKVQSALPNLHLILADETGEETWHRLRHYPGIYSLTSDATASKRRVDIVANTKRVELQHQSNDRNAYLNSLQMKIDVYRNERSHIERIVDLSQKTNQFNTNVQRYDVTEVNHHFKDPSRDFYTVTLSDFLSESGIIGVFSIEIDASMLVIEEVLFSCRALGREVENFSLLMLLQQYPHIKNVRIKYTKASRNNPSREWLEKLHVLDEVILKEALMTQLNEQLQGYNVEVTYHE